MSSDLYRPRTIALTAIRRLLVSESLQGRFEAALDAGRTRKGGAS